MTSSRHWPTGPAGRVRPRTRSRRNPTSIRCVMSGVTIPVLAAAARKFKNWSSGGGMNRPNIVFIMADDLGYADLSCNGGRHCSTPNIDRIAETRSPADAGLRQLGGVLGDAAGVDHRPVSVPSASGAGGAAGGQKPTSDCRRSIRPCRPCRGERVTAPR